MKINLTYIAIFLVILKITGVVNWSWWIVFSPILIAAIFLGFVFLILGLAFFIALASGNPIKIKYKKNKNN